MAQTPLYVGIFLDAPSRVQLLALAPPKHPTLSADHLTLIHMPAIKDLQNIPLETSEYMQVTSIITTTCIQVHRWLVGFLMCYCNFYMKQRCCIMLSKHSSKTLQIAHTLSYLAVSSVSVLMLQATTTHCSNWAFKVIKHAHGGCPHVTVSTAAGVKAKTAGHVVRHVIQGHAHGVTHVVCKSWIR